MLGLELQPEVTKQRSPATPTKGSRSLEQVTFDHGGNVPYIEGQSIGVIAPGPWRREMSFVPT